ncbi:aminoacyl-tRNA deacylase [Chryseobacterium sp. CBo1]|uniref:Cys-tRNA(Pro) deacylase n=1 Tax=Chryseobacterium sp. CBo1 TaxID=1869230 RepID=UPI000810903A|nr:Cys-tRNA(Pro) deacylase [Chryseobacterium sp. CBo1]OCK53437.1 aminoacyl-tRNA deacylase [Chryseobacterium sp. CBo1]
MEKTNATRTLDRLQISYELNNYHIDGDDLSAVHLAEINGIDINTLYKTLVLVGEKTNLLVAIIPGNATLDLKKLAKLSQNKNCKMLPTKDLLKFTGYVRGGCSPIGMKKQFPTYVDNVILNQELVYVNGGKKGTQLTLNPNELIAVTSATVGNIIV